MIYIFAIVYLSCLFFRVYKDWSSSLLLTPISSLSIVSFLLLFLPALLDNTIEISLTVVVGLVTLSLLCIYTPSSFKKKLYILKVTESKILEMVFLIVFLIHITITIKFALDIVNSYGLFGSFVRNRLDDYLNSDIGSGSGLKTLHLMSQFVFYFFTGRILVGKYKLLGVAVICLYVFCIAIYANTRLSIIIPILVFVSYFCYISNMGFKRVFIVSLVFLSLLPTYLVIANNLRHGIQSVDSEVSAEKIIADQLDYNKYVNELNKYYDGYEKFEYGSGWLLASFGNVVPRFIWESKPVTSFSNRLTVLITQKELSLWNPVRTYTIFGTGYSQFYYFGVFLETLFYAYVFSRLFFSFLRIKGGAFFAGYIACLALIYFRGETPFIQLILIYFTYIFSGYIKKQDAS